MDIHKIQYKLSKYQYLLKSNPSKSVYLDKVTYYNNLLGGTHAEKVSNTGTLIKVKTANNNDNCVTGAKAKSKNPACIVQYGDANDKALRSNIYVDDCFKDTTFKPNEVMETCPKN